MIEAEDSVSRQIFLRASISLGLSAVLRAGRCGFAFGLKLWTQSRREKSMNQDSTKTSATSSRDSADKNGHLSDVELQILELVVHRCNNSKIAGELGISVEALKTHFKSIFKKMAISADSDLNAGNIEMEFESFEP
jgi:DNA-binding NarL/FixJ family response regulator